MESSKRKNRVEEIDNLYNSVRDFRSTERTGELMHFIAKFPAIAPYNAMLVYFQKPGSEFVATATQWRAFGRYPKPNANPLVILKQFGPVSFVYDVGDTYGDPLPEGIVDPFGIKGHFSGVEHKKLIDNLPREGIALSYGQYGPNMAGKIQRTQYRVFDITSGIKHYQVRNCFEIVVNGNLSMVAEAAAIFHELGHYFCGHFHLDDRFKHIPQREIKNLNDGIMEFEAETVCWLLCERLGIDNPSEEYLSGYLDKNHEIPEGISIDAILKACGRIESMVYGTYKTPKELIVGQDGQP